MKSTVKVVSVQAVPLMQRKCYKNENLLIWGRFINHRTETAEELKSATKTSQ